MKTVTQNSKKLKALSATRPSSGLRKRLYTVPELVRLTGISRKQVAYWARIKLLNPVMREPNARNGSPSSFYSAKEVVKALIICDLRRAGFSLRQIQ